MQFPESVAPFVPRVEEIARFDPRVRRLFLSIKLSGREPARTRAYAVLCVRARFLVREEWRSRVETSPQARVGAVPAAPDDFLDEPVNHCVFLRITPEDHRCTGCMVAGRQLCGVCGGRGIVSDGRDVRQCKGCNGARYLACSVCEGTARARYADALHLTDQTDVLERRYFPGSLGGDVFALDTFLASQAPPAPLAISLDARSASQPYRDAAPSRRDVWGLALDDAWERAVADVIAHLARQPFKHEASAFAWPVLELTYRVLGRDYHVLLAHDAGGVPYAFVDWQSEGSAA